MKKYLKYCQYLPNYPNQSRRGKGCQIITAEVSDGNVVKRLVDVGDLSDWKITIGGKFGKKTK